MAWFVAEYFKTSCFSTNFDGEKREIVQDFKNEKKKISPFCHVFFDHHGHPIGLWKKLIA